MLEQQTNSTPKPTRSDRLNALMDDIEGFPDSTPAENPDPSPEKSETPPEDNEETQPESEEKPDDAASDEETEEGNTDDVPTPKPDVEEDKVTAKRLAAIERAERRSKETIAAERKELERELEGWRPQIEEAKQFAEMKSKARYDVAGVLMRLGLTEDQFESAARELYALSPAAQSNPKAREAAVRSQKEREYADKITQLERRLEETERQSREREERVETERQVAAYIESVAKSVGDDTPLVSSMLANNPEKTRQSLHEIAAYLADQSGEAPDPEDVIQALEDSRRRELKDLGIDDPSLIFKNKSKKQTVPVADKNEPARTLTNDLGTRTKAKTVPRDRSELMEELLREL